MKSGQKAYEDLLKSVKKSSKKQLERNSSFRDGDGSIKTCRSGFLSENGRMQG